MSDLFEHLACGRCAEIHQKDELQSVCRACGGPLLARYRIVCGEPSLSEVLARRPGQNRLWELMPTRTGADTPHLGEGATPLLSSHRLGEDVELSSLWIKDESQNPTCSFKARGMATAVARARELGVRALALPTAGNAGGAAAAYGALHGIEVHIHAPKNTPTPIIAEARSLGAHVTLVSGTIADAGRASASEAAAHGRFSVATLREPYRIEGKKVMGFELLYDLGRLPDVVVYPTGGGTGLIGMWKAFNEMEALGWIGQERPRMVAVQVEGCAPMVRAFHEGKDTAPAWEDPAVTAAFGLRVPGALGDFLILRALRESSGTAVAVSEEALLSGTADIARLLGIQAAPEGGACLAAIRSLVERGWIAPDECVVLFNTGHGLKYGG